MSTPSASTARTMSVSPSPSRRRTATSRVLASGSPEEPPDQGSGGPMFYTSGTTGFPKGVRGTLNHTGLPPSMLQLIAGAITGGFGVPEDGVTLLEGPLYHSAQWAFSVAPMVAVPTTAGTGAEVGRAALLTLADGRKLGFISPNLIPRRAICDPELTLGLPAFLTAATGLDALSHCIETLLSPRVNPPAEAIALDGAARDWQRWSVSLDD